MWILNRYSDFIAVDSEYFEGGSEEFKINDMMTSFINIHKYEFDGLKATTEFEYNPIENYRMVESEGVERTPNLTTATSKSFTQGEQNNESNSIRTPELNKESTSTKNFGEKTINKKEDFGTKGGSTTVEYGAIQEITDVDLKPAEQLTTKNNSTIPYDIKSFVDTDKETNENAVLTHEISNNTKNVLAHSDTTKVNEDAYTNTTSDTQNEYTDTDSVVEKESGTDTTNFTEKQGERSDSSTENVQETGNEKTRRNLTRSGNIGVTTSQQMIEAERELLNFSLFEYVVSKFIQEYFYLEDAYDWNDCVFGDSCYRF